MTELDGLHYKLLELGGRVPDEALAEARLNLADGQTEAVAGLEASLELVYTFAPVAPNSNTFGGAVPPLLDLVDRSMLTDEFDRTAIRTVENLPGAVALWRVWRTAPDGAADAIPPTRMFVLEADTLPAAATAVMMRDLVAAGIAAPQVEVYQPGDELPAYTRQARDASALLWTAGTVTSMRIARVFDTVDANGPRFDPAHPRLNPPAQNQAIAYLEGGVPILVTTGTMTDVVDPRRGSVVPMSYRTDGAWLWTETVTYYLRTHSLAPEPDLLAHIRVAGAVLPPPDAAAEHRALALLFQSREVAPVWTA